MAPPIWRQTPGRNDGLCEFAETGVDTVGDGAASKRSLDGFVRSLDVADRCFVDLYFRALVAQRAQLAQRHAPGRENHRRFERTSQAIHPFASRGKAALYGPCVADATTHVRGNFRATLNARRPG